MTIECPKCQTENLDSKKFCGDCGTPLPGIENAIHTKTLETPKEELTRGTLFTDRYEIIEELGKGGMGKVYRVEDTKVKEEVALKLINAEIALDKKTIERFSNELKLARKITHKNICRMYDLGEERGRHYLTMEYVSGQDLKGLIRQTGQLTVGKAISIAKQICDGLTEAHSLGIVHRDLKPNNIMIDRGGNAKIMDFGIARAVKGKSITGSGVMIGTPQYMSPEQVEGKDVDLRSDIYSLGIILYEMLTARVPFEGDTPLTVGVKQKTKTPKDPKFYNELIPDDLNQLILKCLEKEKENRYQGTEELKFDLEKLEQGLPRIERTEPKTKPLTSREITVRINLKKILIPALVIIVIVAVALFILLKTAPVLDPNRVVVTAFINQTGYSNLDNLGRQAADIVSRGIKTIGSLEVAPISSFNFSQEKNVEEKHFRQMAKNTQASIVIAGEYYTQGENLNFHSQVYDANKQTLSSLPEPISGQMADPSESLERIRNNLMSVVVGICDPRMAMWHNVSTYAPKYEALVEFIKGLELFFRIEGSKSIEHFNRASEIDPQYPLPLFFNAIAHGKGEARPPFIDKINKLQNLSQGERYFLDWLKSGQEGDRESSFRIMLQLEALNPGTMHSFQLAVDAIAVNRPHTALEALNRLDQENIFIRDWGYYWSQLITAHHMIGNHKQELKIAKKAQEIFPQAWDPLWLKIQTLSALGRLKKVHELLEESNDKPQTEGWYPAQLMGTAFEEFKAHGYDEEAEEMLDLVLPLLKDKYEREGTSKYNFAMALFYSSNWTEAEALFKELHESYPERLTYLGALGIFAAKTGDEEEALRISKVLENWDKPYAFGDHTFWQAAISAALGEKEKAVSLLRTAISQGLSYSSLYCRMELEPLWDFPAFIELIKPRD